MNDLVILTREEFYKEAEKRFGSDRKNWIFECPWCQYKQSMSILLDTIKSNGYHDSRRFGQITKKNLNELKPNIDQECLSPTCNYASYGLFGGSLEVDNHRYLSLAEVQNTVQGKCLP